MLVQHRDELLDPGAARLGFLGALEPKVDRIAIHAVECVEKRFCLWILVEFGPEVFRHFLVSKKKSVDSLLRGAAKLLGLT